MITTPPDTPDRPSRKSAPERASRTQEGACR